MRKLFLTFCLLNFIIGWNQSLNFGIGYQFQYASAYREAIQTYNFARPWLEKKQPLLENGLYVNVDYIFPAKKMIHHGIMLNYLFYRSYAINPDFEVGINQHGLNLGYLFRLDGEKLKGFSLDFGASVATNYLDRKINNDFIQNDNDRKLIAVGIGWNFDFKLGYHVPFSASSNMTPFIGFGVGRIFNTQAEAILNQTQTLTGEPCSWMIVARAGIQIELHFSKKNPTK